MREDDFSYDVRKEALGRAKFKCERCWSERDIEFHHKNPVSKGGGADIDNCVVLCSSCHGLAPDDGLLFDELFMKFSSPKEMAKNYEVETEKEAIECWCKEKGYNVEDMKTRIELCYPSKDLIYLGMRQEATSVGGPLGGDRPYGYDYKDEKLVINLKEKVVVKRIFEDYLKGASTKQIVNNLNRENIPSRSEGKWVKSTVASILKNPVYCGFIECDDILKKCDHPSIIEISAFNAVQSEIVKRIRRPYQKYKPRTLPLKH